MNKIVQSYIANVKNPENTRRGRWQLRAMNNRYSMLGVWGLSHVNFARKRLVLDVGCGGGKNLERILKQSKQINAVGVDISPASIQVTKKKNSRAVKDGRLQVVQGQAESLPFASNLFDLVTAFETVYFWDVEKGLAEVYRTLKKGGQLLIVNESQSSKGIEEYEQSIGFTVYTKDELCKIVKKAGFKNIRSDAGENGGWFAIVCEK
ncbi:MAG: class I SAM-dependent methyltransferase [Christensenella sp.]|nr:MAG: class I SAM-dependent methyltransferase [Christensenella sp.]